VAHGTRRASERKRQVGGERAGSRPRMRIEEAARAEERPRKGRSNRTTNGWEGIATVGARRTKKRHAA